MYQFGPFKSFFFLVFVASFSARFITLLIVWTKWWTPCFWGLIIQVYASLLEEVSFPLFTMVSIANINNTSFTQLLSLLCALLFLLFRCFRLFIRKSIENLSLLCIFLWEWAVLFPFFRFSSNNTFIVTTLLLIEQASTLRFKRLTTKFWNIMGYCYWHS
jgi:hypothetical protein